MRTIKTTFALLVAAFALLVGANAFAQANVSNTLTSGKWSETQRLVGDVYQVTKLSQLTASVSTTDPLAIPANAIGDVFLLTAGTSLNDNGISNTLFLYPVSSTFRLTGGTVSYTDTVSQTRNMADTTSASPTVSTTLPREMGGVAITGRTSISTSEVLQVRVMYTVPKTCRWPKC